ncbi:MAG: hypothetical protein U0Q16_22495 [Bryobacteraceae bacterium]
MSSGRVQTLASLAMASILIGTLAVALVRGRTNGETGRTWATLLHGNWISAAFGATTLAMVYSLESQAGGSLIFTAITGVVIAVIWLLRFASRT